MVTQTQSTLKRQLHRARAVFLIGFMGAGKTSVGTLLAERLGWRFVDLDRQIEARRGMSIAEIFRIAGESAFREMETEALQKLLLALSDGDPTVVALGGGAFAQATNREMLEHAGVQVIFLDTTFEELHRRLGEIDETRPLVNDKQRFRQLFNERHPHYMRAAMRIETSDKTILEVAREIEFLIGDQITTEES